MTDHPIQVNDTNPLARAVLADESFDALFPDHVRQRSGRYWTPVKVAARAATIFREHGARRVLDVGCGPGKFCLVAGSVEPELELFGIEQRPGLVRVALQLQAQLGLRNVKLSVGDATLDPPWAAYDGFYFFNPFAENVYPPDERFDQEAAHSAQRFRAELLLVENLLGRARVGTVVVTYHGLGGAIPSSYHVVADDPCGSDRVRAWVQGERHAPGWVWLETRNGPERVPRSDLHGALASLV